MECKGRERERGPKKTRLHFPLFLPELPLYYYYYMAAGPWGGEAKGDDEGGGERGDKTQLSGSVHPIYNLSRSSLGRKGEGKEWVCPFFRLWAFWRKIGKRRNIVEMVQMFCKLTTLQGRV